MILSKVFDSFLSKNGILREFKGGNVTLLFRTFDNTQNRSLL